MPDFNIGKPRLGKLACGIYCHKNYVNAPVVLCVCDLSLSLSCNELLFAIFQSKGSMDSKIETLG